MSANDSFPCCGGNDETPKGHCMDCPAMQEDDEDERPKDAVGPLDYSAPKYVWLQVDTLGDNEDRSEPIAQDAWEFLTWHWNSIGGQEVQYIRVDLAVTKVDEAMAERACRNRYPDWDQLGPGGKSVRLEYMLEDLTAALALDDVKGDKA